MSVDISWCSFVGVTSGIFTSLIDSGDARNCQEIWVDDADGVSIRCIYDDNKQQAGTAVPRGSE